MELRIKKLEQEVLYLKEHYLEISQEMRDFKKAIREASSPYWMSEQFKDQLKENKDKVLQLSVFVDTLKEIDNHFGKDNKFSNHIFDMQTWLSGECVNLIR